VKVQTVSAQAVPIYVSMTTAQALDLIGAVVSAVRAVGILPAPMAVLAGQAAGIISGR